jgi:flagellar basal-body rod protein FlgB
VDDSLVIPALKVALDGLAQRQRAIADNVANISTPGYTARTVDFENALASAVSAQPGASIADLESTISNGVTSDPARLDGNNVNLDNETLMGTKTNLAFSMALRAVDGRFQIVRDALKAT